MIKLHYAAPLVCGLLWGSTALAQPSGAQGDDFIYKVRAGDTLLGISGTYTRQDRNWAHIQRLNTVADPTRLPIGKELRIPFKMIPEVEAPARIVHQAGQIQVNGQTLSDGHTHLKEGDQVRTGQDGYLTLELLDGSQLSVPAAASLRVARMRAFEGTGLIDSIVALEDGDIESRVAPDQQGVGRFEVRTPVSITGVRGTELRVRTRDGHAHSEVLAGQAELGTQQQTAPTALRQNQGAAVATDGRIVAVAPLLPAPQVSVPQRQGGRWSSSIDPVPGAQAYLVQTALDPRGAMLLSRRLVTDTTIQFSAPRPGTYYVMVRAIDSHGLMGPDTLHSFEGAAALSSSDGTPVVSSFGDPILLSQF
ncbi:MAG TPA: FecR domain-containing protein [Alcaligenes faecalis]|nr:FecR domain-containing protein [Alcaligenes faecalis]